MTTAQAIIGAAWIIGMAIVIHAAAIRNRGK